MTTTKVNLANTVEGILPVANGGTGSSTGVSPGGSTTQVQFNNAGAFGGSANLTFDGTTLTAAGLSDSGNLTFTGTGNRITGDFSNATASNRVAFQSSTTNGNTVLQAIPNGTATQTNFVFYSDSAQTNFAALNILQNASETSFRSIQAGSGSYVPVTFWTGGSERLRIDTSGVVDIGGTSGGSVGERLVVEGANSAGHRSARINNTSTTNGYSTLWLGSSNDGMLRGGSTASAFTDQLAMLTSGAIPLTFYTNNTERMRIDSSGNVGIGKTNPSSLLDVKGTISATNSSNNTYSMARASGMGYSPASYGAVVLGQTSGANVTNCIGYDPSGNTGGSFSGSEVVFRNAQSFITPNSANTDFIPVMSFGSTGNFQFNSGYGSVATAYGCRAWVNFNGLAGASIRASGNISSVTFVSTGNYTVNFTTAMPDANYCVTACNSGSFGVNWGIINVNITGSGATEVVPTTSSFAVEIVQPSTARIDSKYIHLAVFR